MKKTRILIVGYGNVGRGVKLAIDRNEDLELIGVASRHPQRAAAELAGVPVVSASDEKAMLALSPDVAILCGGSKNDLPQQGPAFSKLFNTVDSFDHHDCIPEYFAAMDDSARAAGHVAVISTGWDPGIFSLERTLANAFIPGAAARGFYGLTPRGGLSMGHSDALRTIPGIKDARQYTHAIPAAIDEVRNGADRAFRPGDLHTRECFVVLAPGADAAAIGKEIESMPGYFAPYKTTVHFVSEEYLRENCQGFPHDGCVVATGSTGDGNLAQVEYHCRWGSNPEATGNVLAAHARAAARLAVEGKSGAFTILDIPASYLSPHDRATLLKKFM